MTRSERLELRLTPEEREAFEWAAEAEGHESVAAWLRVVGNARVRQMKKQQKQYSEPSLAEKKSSK